MSAPATRRRSPRSAVATLLAVSGLVLAPAFAQAASGESDPGSPTGKGRPHQVAPAAPAGPACELDLGDGPKDEFTGCTDVVLTPLTTPDVGSATVVDVAITSVKSVSGARLTVRANEGFALTGTDGFADAGTQPSGVGPMSAVSRRVDLVAQQTAHVTVEVTGAKAGLGVVQARLDTTGGAFDGGDELDVELGDASLAPSNGIRAVRVPAGTKIAPPRRVGDRKPSLKHAHSLEPGTPGASCATGTWVYPDETATLQPSVYFGIQVWDDDPSGTDDLLASGLTDAAGSFNLCFESTDADEGGGQEVWLKLIAENGAWKVRPDAMNNAWFFFTGNTNLADPGTVNYGTLTAPSSHARLVHAFDSIEKLWQWQSDVGGGFLDNTGETRQMIVNWTTTSTDGTYYSLGGNDIHLAAADPDSDHVTIHEGSHALMDALYDDAFPAAPSCNPHYIFGNSSQGCAWTEGWAEWVPARVLNDPFFRWPDGSFVNLETPSWPDYTGAYGDQAEGRIAGALIDLSDSDNENYWDRFAEGGATAGSEEIYTTANLKQVSTTLADYFVNDRPGEGDTGYFARASVFQNTIDYTHRDPLITQQEMTRPGLDVQPSPHRFSYFANNAYWGGVAIRPPAAADYDLYLYSDEAMSNLTGSSIYGLGLIDYVLVDGNHRTGTFYPATALFGGTGAYTIEEYTGQGSTLTSSLSGSLSATDIIRPYDVLTATGVTQYIGIAPSAGLDVTLAAHVSDGTNGTTTQDRSQAVASSSDLGAGGREFVQYSAPINNDWTGIVVLNESGTAGTYTIYRDVAGPTSPSVTADGGNPQTYDTTVDLALSASNVNTGTSSPLAQMQISTDGVFDTEPWIDYSTTGTATLPAGVGTKTVSVRYRNAAGAISATATDTIDIVATPTCDGQTATVAGFGTVTGTTGNDVIVGGPNADSIFGLGGNDLICGLGGNDAINDGPGADTVYGESGNDVITQPAATDAGDIFDGGSGTDQVSYGARTGNVNVTLDGNNDDGVAGEADTVQTTVENITTGSGNDTLAGTSANNRLIGNGGDDAITGGGGNDYLTGNGGVDTLSGGDGNDTVLAGDGNDTIDEGTAANGTDLVKGGTGNDTITYVARSTAVAIRLNGVATSGAAGENDKLLNCENAIGGTGNDTLVGHVTADMLVGNGGDDTITGNGNADYLIGGAGNDTLSGGNGNDDLDTIDGINGNDTANGGAGTDTASTDPGDIRISIP